MWKVKKKGRRDWQIKIQQSSDCINQNLATMALGQKQPTAYFYTYSIIEPQLLSFFHLLSVATFLL